MAHGGKGMEARTSYLWIRFVSKFNGLRSYLLSDDRIHTRGCPSEWIVQRGLMASHGDKSQDWLAAVCSGINREDWISVLPTHMSP